MRTERKAFLRPIGKDQRGKLRVVRIVASNPANVLVKPAGDQFGVCDASVEAIREMGTRGQIYNG